MNKLRTKQVPRYRLMKSDVALDLGRAIKWAMGAWTKAYCPYSNFRVGAAIITRDGSLFTGCNVECCDHLGTHAEETALASMVMGGKRAPLYLVVVGGEDRDKPEIVTVPPCGNCRQKLMEFADFSNTELKIITDWGDDEYEYILLSDLLPDTFGPKAIGVDLGKYKGS